MDISKQVCDLSSARRLKELGCRQESLWIYTDSDFEASGYRLKLRTSCRKDDFGDYYSAFTVAELGEMLPNNIGAITCNISRVVFFKCVYVVFWKGTSRH